MMTCEQFRGALPDVDTPEALQHLRACDECLSVAAEVDPDLMFRAIGGDELVPPGGTEAFVADVMREVQLREAAKSMRPARRVSSWYGLTAAAAVVTAILSYSISHRPFAPAPIGTAQVASVSETISRPIIESYDNSGATIVEVPTDDNSTKIVMIFDETLPADL